MPVGPSILWPEKARKSHVEVAHIDRQVRHALRAVDQHQRARARAPRATISRTGLIVPSVLRHVRTATSLIAPSASSAS